MGESIAEQSADLSCRLRCLTSPFSLWLERQALHVLQPQGYSHTCHTGLCCDSSRKPYYETPPLARIERVLR
ncbi:MAG: hypothetical protein WKF84_00980 [Pyrinomonadaceae bacterium]